MKYLRKFKWGHISEKLGEFAVCHGHHHHHNHNHLILIMPLVGPETDPRVYGLPINCLKEVTESAILNPLCYPNSYSTLSLSSSLPFSSSSSFSLYPSLMGPETQSGVSGLPADYYKQVIELATPSLLCYPNSYLSELQPEAAEPDFHSRGLVGQFATGHYHLPLTEFLQIESLST